MKLEPDTNLRPLGYLYWAIDNDGFAHFHFNEPVYGEDGFWYDLSNDSSSFPPVQDDSFLLTQDQMDELGIKPAESLVRFDDLDNPTKESQSVTTKHGHIHQDFNYNNNFPSNNSYTGTFHKKCSHVGDTESFYIKLENKTIYIHGAGSPYVDEARNYCDVHLDCSNVFRSINTKHVAVKTMGPYSELAVLETMVRNIPTVSIDWPDRGPPGVTAKFWSTLIETLPDETRLLISCVGSHGRTGTSMTALLLAVGYGNVEDCINFVRQNHCKEAVESKSQERYLDYVHKEMIESGYNTVEFKSRNGEK